MRFRERDAQNDVTSSGRRPPPRERDGAGSPENPVLMCSPTSRPIYKGLPNHATERHKAKQYVTEDGVSTNSVESFWAMLERGYTFHRMSPEHVHRYVDEFAGRHNDRDLDTRDQMRGMVARSEGKRLRYADLISHPHGGRPSPSSYFTSTSISHPYGR